MALVRLGGGVVQISGSIAGDTFARNRYGNYVRARTKPINPNTALQQTVRGAMASLTTRWGQTLSAAQRTAWNLYASNVAMKNRLGEVINLTGFNHYIRSNMPLLQNAKTPIDDGPTLFELPSKDPTLSIALSEATQAFTVTFDDTLAWGGEDNAYLFMLGGQPQNAQRNFFAGPYQNLEPFPGDTAIPLTSPMVVASSYAVAELQHVWLQARIARADGRLSEPFRADTFCAA